MCISCVWDESECCKEREYCDEFELVNVKWEFDEIKWCEICVEEEKWIKKEFELKRFREEEEVEVEKKCWDEEVRLVVECYK